MVRRSKVTSFDVARLAGVNQSTVSRALSGDGRVSVETRQRVRDAAERLGYTPNAIARSLITRQTHIVGILTADITIPFQAYVLETFIQKLQGLGKQVLVFTAAPDQTVDDLLPTALQYQIDALIVTSATLVSRALYECSRGGTAVVLFNRYMEGDLVNSVSCDNLAAGRMVADFLLNAGHRRLAYIAGDPNSSTNRDRQGGFMERLWERGAAKPVVVESGRYTYDAGHAAALRLLERPNPPDAVFCASDGLALGTIDAARELGIAIPDVLSVVGFDDIPMAGWSAYSLTTVRLPLEEMIDATIQLALDRGDGAGAPVTRRFPGTLVERRSSRAPATAKEDSPHQAGACPVRE
ncbi:MAG: LacI family DNA-binding transcriptional regulator [Chloroflexi bacterium]|nr:LacI family DNA-binding transcriptional regulator [Chloroflexota bacterium]